MRPYFTINTINTFTQHTKEGRREKVTLFPLAWLPFCLFFCVIWKIIIYFKSKAKFALKTLAIKLFHSLCLLILDHSFNHIMPPFKWLICFPIYKTPNKLFAPMGPILALSNYLSHFLMTTCARYIYIYILWARWRKPTHSQQIFIDF